ncbi:MAG: energy transducer TonB [Dysgonomonas sp.]
MRNVLIVFVLLLVAMSSMGQENEVTFKSDIFMPSFPGGEAKMHEFINDRFYFPSVALDKGITGRVTTRFVVEETGQLGDIKIIRGIHPECDSVAIKIVRAMPRWNPAYRIENRKEVKVPIYFTLPFIFSSYKVIDQDTIYWKPDSSPYFEGGEKSLSEFLRKNVK